MSVSFSTIVQRARPPVLHATTAAMRQVLSKISPTTVSSLTNGVRVACEETKSPFATVGLYLDCGTKYEDRKTNGIAKLLESCGFVATTNRDGKQLARVIDEVGGHLMVETGREHSYVAVKCHRDNIGKAVNVLADVVRNARLSDEDVQQVKAAQVEKFRRKDENVDQMVFDNLHACAFDSVPTGGLGLGLYGTEDSLPQLDGDAAREFRKTHFTANRMVLVGTGGVKHAELEKLAQENFGDLRRIEAAKPKVVNRYVGGDIRMWNLRFKTAHIAWAFETCGANSGDVVPLTLATNIHGNFHRSHHELGQHAMHRVLKVFSSIDHGTPGCGTHFPEKAVETVNTFIRSYEEIGLAGMYIVGRPCPTGSSGPADSMHELLQYTMHDWCRMSQRNMYPAELEQAKVMYKAQLLLARDGSTNSFEETGRQVLYHGRRLPLEDLFARIDDTTATNVAETLEHYFTARRPVFSMAGYIYILPAYDHLVHWTYKYAF